MLQLKENWRPLQGASLGVLARPPALPELGAPCRDSSLETATHSPLLPTHPPQHYRTLGHLSGLGGGVEKVAAQTPGLHVKRGPHLGPPAPGYLETKKGSATGHGAGWPHGPCLALGHLLADPTAHPRLFNPLHFMNLGEHRPANAGVRQGPLSSHLGRKAPSPAALDLLWWRCPWLAWPEGEGRTLGILWGDTRDPGPQAGTVGACTTAPT